MSSNKKKRIILAVFFSLSASACGNAYAAEQPENTDLGETIVTATRTQKRDLDVPASTTIITAQEIQQSEAKNADEVLRNINGFTYMSFGPTGASLGTMSNDLIIRGVKNGTLVLLNGSPIDWRGRYNIDEIPSDQIQRIEIVKGGGSVLYGSEAMGGVVNIITKHGGQNFVRAGIGNFGQRDYVLGAGDNTFSVLYNYEKWGELDNISQSHRAYRTFTGTESANLRNAEKESISATYRINPRLNFLFGHYDTTARYDRYALSVTRPRTVHVGDPTNTTKYDTEQYITQLNYDDHDWKGGLYFNTGTVKAEGPTYIASTARSVGIYSTREKNARVGADIQRTFRIGTKSQAITGMHLEHESFQKLPAPSTSNPAYHGRNNWGVFGQWEQKLDEKNTATIGLRESFTTGATRNYHNLSGALSYLHKLDNTSSIYASVNQSFVMPTFTQMYGADDQAIAAPNLKPQKGTNYETGYKYHHNGHEWKAALFHTDISDNITARWRPASSTYQYTNEDFNNTGIEAESVIHNSKGMTYRLGLTWQNPQTKTNNGQWHRIFGKIQLDGGVSYQKGKWTSSLTASYLASRVLSTTHEYARPYLLTSWNTSYMPDDHQTISLLIDNLLDRDDQTGHSSAQYRVAPTNFLVNYEYKF